MAMVQVRCMRVAVDHGLMAMGVAVRRVPRVGAVDVRMVMVRLRIPPLRLSIKKS